MPFPLVLLHVTRMHQPISAWLHPPFHVAGKSDKVGPEPHFFQANHPKLPQLLVISHMLQTLSQFGCPSLDMLQDPQNPSCTEGPRIKQRIQGMATPVWSIGDNHPPGPAGHVIAISGHNAIGLLGTWAC